MKLSFRRRFWLSTALLAAGAWGGWEIAVRCVTLPAGLSECPATPVLLDVHGREIAELARNDARAQRPVSLAEMGEIPRATVALEDHRFYEHGGIDWHALAGSLGTSARRWRQASGASTITQQLIKLATRRTGRDWRAKIYENLAAVRLEREWSKERILEAYLNRSDYGNRLVGPAAASQTYFGRPPSELNFREAVFLASLPQAPTRFNPWSRPLTATARRQRAELRVRQLGLAANLEGFPEPVCGPRRFPPRSAPHFVEHVRQTHGQLRGRVATTLDLDLQQFAEKALARQLALLEGRHATQGGVVILDVQTGAVRAMVGSAGFTQREGQINGATIYRSCGSTLKPFLYLQAIEARVLTAATLLPDTPDAIRAEYIDYDPMNYDHRSWGPVRVREALANSLNVPAVIVLSRLGARDAFLGLQDSGLRFARPFKDYGAGLILGNAEIRLVDLASVFTAFANHGVAVRPRLLDSDPIRQRALASPEAAAIVADILCDNDARRKTFGPFSPLAFEDARVPCKTGTSSGFRDSWTVGATAKHVVGVWIGNFSGRPMDEVASISGAAPLWRELVNHLLPEDGGIAPPAVTTDSSSRLMSREICRLTGLHPAPASPGTISEWFLPGTEPQDSATKMLRDGPDGPYLELPPEYALWCHGGANYLGARVVSQAPLAIVNPRPGSTLLLDPHLPAAQQMIRLVSTGAAASADARWSVDGVDASYFGGEPFWQLTPGRHHIALEIPGATVDAYFTVE